MFGALNMVEYIEVSVNAFTRAILKIINVKEKKPNQHTIFP